MNTVEIGNTIEIDMVETLSANRISPLRGFWLSSVLGHRAMPYVNDYRALPYNPLIKAESLLFNSMGQHPMTQNDEQHPMTNIGQQRPIKL